MNDLGKKSKILEKNTVIIIQFVKIKIGIDLGTVMK